MFQIRKIVISNDFNLKLFKFGVNFIQCKYFKRIVNVSTNFFAFCQHFIEIIARDRLELSMKHRKMFEKNLNRVQFTDNYKKLQKKLHKFA